MSKQMIAAGDVTTYAAAASLVEYLVARRGRQEVISCARTAAKADWEAALKEHFEFASLPDLDRAWRDWAEAELRITGSNK